ncbi:hypothetical protein, partial [Stutzerimonas kunmingensis]|uniref:hypothetical protein n=1 Tax=Stutzerimonas kunmingensis TaxID=1211807 RepID=UPI00241D4CDA
GCRADAYDGCDGWMNGVGVELAQGFFGLVDLLGEIGDVVCPAGFGSVLDEGLAGIESMPIAELPGDSGFALLGESLFPDAEKVTKNALPLHPAPRSARGRMQGRGWGLRRFSTDG